MTEKPVKTKTPPGIDARHAKACASRAAGSCGCKPTYQAHVFDARSGRRIRKTFPTLSAAKKWRQEASVALRNGTLQTSDGRTVRDVGVDWLEAARQGQIRNKSGLPYKPASLRTYELCLRLRIYPAIGGAKFTSIRRVDLQDLVDRLSAEGSDPTTIQCSLMPLRAMYRRALSRGEVTINPTTGLELPAIRSRRDRIASPAEAQQLLDALPEADRPLWAVALYAGLRRGELRALRWEDVDLIAGVIRVQRGWDEVEGEIEPKSATGRRTVPIPGALRGHLEAQWVRGGTGRLVFGQNDRPFAPKPLRGRAVRSWDAAGLTPISLHECRHTYASFMIAAGVNAKSLSTYLGHANISTTFDLYGHLMPGNEAEAAGLLDEFLAG